MVLTPKTAVKSSSTRERSGTDSFYFPGCRKNIDCNCDMCLASINATLDLSSNFQKQVSIAKTPETKNMVPMVTTASPALHSTAKSMPIEMKEREERRKGLGFGSGGSLVMWLVVIFAILMVDFVVPVMVVRVSGGPKMSAEMVRTVGEELDVKKVVDFRGRLRFLEERLGYVSGEKINNCSSAEKNWVLDKDGPLLHIRCILYKNMVEEVSIWGFPVQTSGLLTTTGLSPKSFTVISGKINQWSGSKLQFNGRRRGESWISSKRNATAVELTGNTWILEYNQSPLLQDSRIIPLVKDFVTSRASHVMNEILHFDWLLQSSYRSYYAVKSSNHHVDDGRRGSSMPPT